MKSYEVAMHRTEHKTVTLTANSPQQAIDTARTKNPGFQANDCVSLDEDGEVLDAYEILAECESCDKMIFDETECKKGATDSDGIFVCEACKDEMRSAKEEGR